ncbi:MAG: hypothetical protein JO214_14150 [Frankiaceae bacterium]|nr:hypothetical protein [Frankiaceae bacterium]
MIVVAGVAVALLLASLGISTTYRALGPGKQWYEYVVPTAIAVVAIAVLVLVLGS